MLDAIEVPFDASKYAFRTNFDPLTITNDAASARLKDAKNNFQSALINFESSDKKARDIYKDEKDDGLTTDSFGTWVVQNYPQWPGARNQLQAHGASLTQVAMNAFGEAYRQKLQNDQSGFNMAAYKDGHYPELF